MARADAVLEVFPSFFGAGDAGKLLGFTVSALAEPLDEADAHVFRIQRAHRLLVAQHATDIVRLSAALDLDEFHFEDLLADPALEYEVLLQMMRERVQRVARLHLDGLGTPWAVIEGAAIFLNATVVPDAEGEPLIRHLDFEGYSHRATLEFPHAAGRPRERIVLHENPFRRNKVEPAERWPDDVWTVDNESIDVSPIRVAIQGVGDRTIFPTIFCPQLQKGIVFNGVVPDGRTLLIDEDAGARLDDEPVDHWLLTYEGGMFNHVPQDAATFAVEEAVATAPYVGAPDQVDPGYGPRPALPKPPLGRSNWGFSVSQGIYDDREFELAVYDRADAPVGQYDADFAFDGCVYDVPPNAVVGMAWDERIPCSFMLLLPDHLPALGDGTTSGQAPSQPVNYAGRVGTVLPRFRAAGIRAFVDTAPPSWILGQGVVRSSDASDGEGADFHTLELRGATGENLVPFDPSTMA
jgi:hypothetical protein